MENKISMDFVKLDDFDFYQLYSIMRYQANSKIKGGELTRQINYLRAYPMTSEEAKQMLHMVKQYSFDLSDAYEDDWEHPFYKLEEQSIHIIVNELERIMNLEDNEVF